MILLARLMGHCATCSHVATTWPVPTVAPTLVVRITVTTRSGSGGTLDVCEYHARQLVHSPDYGDDRCGSCGHRGAVQQIGPTTHGTRTRYAVSVCRARCAPALATRIGVAVTLGDGDRTEWDDSYQPAPWQSSSEQIREAMDFARRGRGRS